MHDDIRELMLNIGLVTQLGMVVVFCLLIGLAFGYLAERLIQHGFVFRLIGVVLGLAAGIWQAYRLVMTKIK